MAGLPEQAFPDGLTPGDDASPVVPKGLDRVEFIVVGLALALLVLWSPAGNLGLLTPRMALALALAGPGLVVIAVLALQRDRAAQVLAVLLGWGLIAALTATLVRPSLIGSYGSDIGWIWMAAYAGAWGAGRWLRPRGARALIGAILIGAVVNAVLAILEVALEPTGALALQDGRAVGLLLNPVFLGGVLAGTLAMMGRLVSVVTPKRWLILAGIAVVVAGANLSGSRAAVVAGAILAIAGSWVATRTRAEPPPTSGVRRYQATALVVGAVALGLVVSVPFETDVGGTSRAIEVSTSSGYTSRTLAWEFGLDAAGERPLVGWGPGRFREAIETRTTAEYVRAEGPDRVFYDAHNIFIEYLVATGVIGLALLVGFVVLAARHARGPLGWFALGVGFTWLLNPMSVVTAPLALLALGASWVRGPPSGAGTPSEAASVHHPVLGSGARALAAGLAVLGLVIGAGILITDRLVDEATRTGDLDAALSAQRINPGDATLTDLVASARLHAIAEDGMSPERREALQSAARQVTKEDPSRPNWWIRRGLTVANYGAGTDQERLDEAEQYFLVALERSPWSIAAINALMEVARARGDDAALRDWEAKRCEAGFCVPAE